MVTSQRVQFQLQKRAGMPVELAMRYQSPSAATAVRNLVAQGVEELLLIPLFPHYAMSSFETAVEHIKRTLAREAPNISLQVKPPYYQDPLYIEALASSAEDYLKEEYDHLLFSFHGIPERHLRKSDPTGRHCLATPDCCAQAHVAHDTCYRAQCFKTMQAFLATLRRRPVNPPSPSNPGSAAIPGSNPTPTSNSSV